MNSESEDAKTGRAVVRTHSSASDLHEDFRRCGNGRGFGSVLRELSYNPAMWAVFVYRFRRWLYVARPPAVIRWPLNIVAILMSLRVANTTNIELPSSAAIGGGLYIAHPAYVMVGSHVVIGRHCTLTQGVTIGHAGGGSHTTDKNPVIGDRVYIGPGAIIIGPITIGNDALIGAGAVVTRSVPDRGVAVGNPARVISHKGSFDLISYPGMEQDEERIAALAACELVSPAAL